jgi:hypothetical protein
LSVLAFAEAIAFVLIGSETVTLSALRPSRSTTAQVTAVDSVTT